MILARIQEAAARYPEKVAIQMKAGDRYQKYSYRDVLKQVNSVASSLVRRGIEKGDRVAILSENRPEWMIAYLAVVACRAVIVPLDAQLGEKEVSLLLSSSEAKAIFVSASCRRKLPGKDSPLIILFDPDDGILFSDMLATRSDASFPPLPAANDPAALLYTSGTTGDPKGVMLSQYNLASNLASVIKLDLFDHRDNFLCILPLHHTYPSMGCLLLPLSLGASVTILNSLKGPDILACMKETGISIIVGVPQLYAGLRRAIFDEIDKKPRLLRTTVRFLLTSNKLFRNMIGINVGKFFFQAVHEKFGPQFRILASGGARLEPDVYSDMTNLGFTLLEGYGLTETSPIDTFNPLSKRKAGSIGIPVPDVEVRIANSDENGRGEIAVRGPNVMLGYYKKPQETSEVIRDGWFYTGDLGYCDADGYFFITGRSKEMLVLSTGKKIFPDELEKFYKQIPSIKEICLLEGERGLEAAVVPNFDYLRKMNLSNSRETIAFAIEDLAKELPPYKRITGLKIFKEDLPATRLGKLRRSKVRELYQKEGESAESTVQKTDNGLLADPVAKRLLECLLPFSSKKWIVPDDNLELDLGLDSLARVEVVVSIEKTFGISLPDSFGAEVFTVNDALLRIKERLASGPLMAGDKVQLSWADILAQEPDAAARDTIQLEFGQFWKSVRFLSTYTLSFIMKIYGRLKVSGLENLPEKGPYLITPNHLSLADAPVVMAALSWETGSQVFFLGAKEYFGGPVTSKIAKFMQVIPVDMDTRLYNALQLSAYVLRNKKVLCVFPEGSRSRDGSIKEFKKGVGIVAKELGIPVVPVAIRGTYEMLPTGSKIPYPSKIFVSFGKPIQPEKRDYDQIVGVLHQEVVRLLQEGNRPDR